ncbi:hypothetical protein HJ588_18815 [Flexivirga sp. ID2601S]|uniref:Thioredoxin domain-containing protein n=1 Tax=Flexivirga aerilata TaxID=1656889 RepID=A0A849AKG2_9MICO|nr:MULTISPECIES: hypothetical protein [Flexivirga]NNG41314.1 hypothetical protein [Flexivirga aerilata]
MTVVTTLLTAAVFILAIAVTLLFAMIGELSSRESGPSAATESSDWVEPIPDFRRDLTDIGWPPELRDTATTGLIIVLSSICSTCSAVARSLNDDAHFVADNNVHIVVSTATSSIGQDFIDAYNLSNLRPYLDVGGNWVVGSLGINSSPSAVYIQDGLVRSAYNFGSIDALESRILEDRERLRALRSTLDSKGLENEERVKEQA